jgi:hypothetical protein
MPRLFGKAKGTISEHIKHIFGDGELDPAATVRPFRTHRQGVRARRRTAQAHGSRCRLLRRAARIREIRASEARVYQRVREIFALASDYDESDQVTLRFFAVMENKMHYAATGLTAAEIVRRRADAEKPNMGLTNWSGGRVLKRDVGTARNYLDAMARSLPGRIDATICRPARWSACRFPPGPSRGEPTSSWTWRRPISKRATSWSPPARTPAGRPCSS